MRLMIGYFNDFLLVHVRTIQSFRFAIRLELVE